jgi:methylated-DNA-[protein]-cysteine S-methyltransferase
MFDKTHLLSLTQTNKSSSVKTFYAQEITTPIGTILAIADEDFLYYSSFINEKSFEKIKNLLNNYSGKLLLQSNKILELTKYELNSYFDNSLKKFTIPLKFTGTDFQIKCWQELSKIPYGKTISYLDEATNIGKPTAFRAVANANGKNLFPVIIPCHRVINSNGKLGGYTGGVEKKIFLLGLEKAPIKDY